MNTPLNGRDRLPTFLQRDWLAVASRRGLELQMCYTNKTSLTLTLHGVRSEVYSIDTCIDLHGFYVTKLAHT